MERAKRAATWVALLTFLVAVAVYLVTLNPSVPFWDAGEFIAVSYILGIPHPPGTPFYVLLGRVATLVPWGSIAERVNALSAIPAALAVMLTYLTILRLVRIAQTLPPPKPTIKRARDSAAVSPEAPPRTFADEWIAHLAAFAGALMLAFSDSFWENSIEAEVYALMSLAQALVLWLGLKWWEEHERRPTAGPLLLAVYVMWLCVGLHLGVGIMGLPLMVLVWLVDRRAAIVFAMPILSVLLVTMGLERMAGAVMLFSMIVFLIYAAQRKIPGLIALASAVGGLIAMAVAFGDRDFTPGTALLGAASVLVPMALLARKTRDGKIIALALLLMVLGYSNHTYLPIRAAQKPAINEGAPSTWSSLRDLLERKQYGTMNMFVRRAPLSAQMDKEFWRYFRRQWPLFPTDRTWGGLLPLALGIAGGLWLLRRNRTAFVYSAIFVGVTTAGMIVFLNFTDHEVRERDYFFQSGYHAYTIWIGLGAAWLIGWIRESFAPGNAQRVATATAAAAMLAQPALLARNLWFTHDMSRNFVAHDYAYNMLAPLQQDGFLFTNGDNDTFPLWYMQQVERFRPDVRVVNLSLLNTDWYIRQLRDEEPKVPITLDDATITMLGGGAIRDDRGNIIYTSEFMVPHILEQTQQGGGWKKQPYVAVTVPEHYGFDPYFSLEGLVYRVNRDTLQAPVDVEATRENLYEVFKYRGLFLADGSWDSTVFKDENAATLSRNYAAAHIQLAFHYRRQGDIPRAIQEMERVSRMFPDFTDVLIPLGGFYMDIGDTANALRLFQGLAARNPNDAEARYYHGVLLVYQGRLQDGLGELDAAIRLSPSYRLPYYAAYYALSEAGDRERSLQYLERWLAANPDDPQARQILESERGSVTPPGSPMPQPPLPQLP